MQAGKQFLRMAMVRAVKPLASGLRRRAEGAVPLASPVSRKLGVITMIADGTAAGKEPLPHHCRMPTGSGSEQ